MKKVTSVESLKKEKKNKVKTTSFILTQQSTTLSFWPSNKGIKKIQQKSFNLSGENLEKLLLVGISPPRLL